MKQERIFAVKNLNIGLPEFGHIKIGKKGDEIKSKSGTKFQPPEKLDHFIITTMERGGDDNFQRDEALHELYGPEPKEIPVRLVYADIGSNFPHQWACYDSKTAWCRGDGEKASRLQEDGTRKEVDCTCERAEYDFKPGPGDYKCKLNGCLSVIIDGAPRVGGVWTFRTTSWNSVTGLIASLQFVQLCTGGLLAGIPLKMRVFPKVVTIPGTKTTTTVYIVGLFSDGSMSELAERGLAVANLPRQIAELSASDDQVLPYDENGEIIEEFYPEEPEPEPLVDRLALCESIADLEKLRPEAEALEEGDEKELCRHVYQKKYNGLKGSRARDAVKDKIGGDDAGLPG